MSNINTSAQQAGASAPAETAQTVRISRTVHSGMIEILKLALEALNVAPRFRVGDTNSYAIASRITAILKQAEGDHQ
jgi:hypothetical protein